MSLEIKIVNATINIFKEKGVKFTMDDLANNLGVSKRTLYENIDSKETLLNLLVDDIFDSITQKGKEILNDDKFPFMIGGEHLVTLPAFKAVYEKYDDVYVLHFDAHTDLR